MSITPLPTPPNRTDAPALFTARANAFVDALAAMVTEFNEALPALIAAEQSFTPTSGATVTIVDSVSTVIEVFLRHTSTIATATVQMPPNPFNGQKVMVCSRAAITTATFSATGGKSLIGNTNLPAAGHATWRYLAVDSLWYRAE